MWCTSSGHRAHRTHGRHLAAVAAIRRTSVGASNPTLRDTADALLRAMRTVACWIRTCHLCSSERAFPQVNAARLCTATLVLTNTSGVLRKYRAASLIVRCYRCASYDTPVLSQRTRRAARRPQHGHGPGPRGAAPQLRGPGAVPLSRLCSAGCVYAFREGQRAWTCGSAGAVVGNKGVPGHDAAAVIRPVPLQPTCGPAPLFAYCVHASPSPIPSTLALSAHQLGKPWFPPVRSAPRLYHDCALGPEAALPEVCSLSVCTLRGQRSCRAVYGCVAGAAVR